MKNIRYYAFWVFDWIKGGPIKKKVLELQEFSALSEERQLSLQTKKLQTFLLDVLNHTPYYQEFKRRRDVSDDLILTLKDFPVINKKLISDNPNQFYSEQHSRNKLISVHTSGSYGTPLTYYLSLNKKYWQRAEVLYFGESAHYEVGVCHGYIRSVVHKRPWLLFLQNEFYFPSKHLDETFLSNALHLLRTKDIRVLIGFSSPIAMIAEEALKRGFKSKDFKLQGVITSSENLTEEQRATIKKAFDCVIVNRYSTEEFGVLGIEVRSQGGFVLNICNYVVEILKIDSDESVQIGEIGRIVVTDLHSNAMPLVRYDTGDLGVLGGFFDQERGWASSILKLSGRMMQIVYSTAGTALYPLFLDNIMDDYDLFSRYQFIQRSSNQYEILLVFKEGIKMSSELENGLIEQFQNWLGKDAEIIVRVVDDIECLPSGKRPFVINKTFKESL